MDERQRAGFLIGMAIGFDMDSSDVEVMLARDGLTLDDDLMECQNAIKAHVGDRRWRQGVGLHPAADECGEEQLMALYIFDVDKTLVGPLDGFAKVLDDQQPLPGVIEKLAELRAQGHALAAATQKGGCAWGIMTEAMANTLIKDALRKVGGVDAWRVCYNDPKAARIFPDSVLSRDHPWRKPNPGMLISLMDELEFSPDQTTFVGDMDTDRQAAQAAGVTFVWAKDFFSWGEHAHQPN